MVKFTDILGNPKYHNEDNFIYLVHGVMDIHYALRKLNSLLDPDLYYRASLVGRLTKEESLKRFNINKELNQLVTYGNLGFIISCPDEDIKIAWYSDICSPNDPEELRKFVESNEGKILDPLYILYNSVAYNELVIQGGNTKILGIFYNDFAKLDDVTRLASLVKKLVGEEVPIIKFADVCIEDVDNEKFLVSHAWFKSYSSMNLKGCSSRNNDCSDLPSELRGWPYDGVGRKYHAITSYYCTYCVRVKTNDEKKDRKLEELLDEERSIKIYFKSGNNPFYEILCVYPYGSKNAGELIKKVISIAYEIYKLKEEPLKSAE